MVIIAAVDRSSTAGNVAKEAEILAKAFDDTVHVVHVLTQSGFLELGQTSAESGDAISMEEVRATAAEFAADAATGLDVEWEAVGLVGKPADRIVDYADDHDVRYIVVGPRRRSPTGKAVFGSVAQSILLNSDIPVVTTIQKESN